MVQINFLNEQLIYDVFYMSKPEFIVNYTKLLPEVREMELNIIRSGIIENFSLYNQKLSKSSSLDKSKLLKYKQNLMGYKVNEEEQRILDSEDLEQEIQNILLQNNEYRYQSDKIKGLLKLGISDQDIILKFNQYLEKDITIGYINSFKK